MVKINNSTTNHREVEVLDALRRLGGSARNSNIADLLGVSEETVRRTTKALAKSDLVRRVHGGAYLPDAQGDAGVFSRLGQRSDEKAQIARAAARLIPNGACLFLDVGSTTAFVAHALRKHENLFVVTNSLNAAQSLAKRRGNRVFLAGGELRDAEWGTFGPEAEAYVRNFRFDYALLSVDGINKEVGFLLSVPSEAALARAVIARSACTIVAADHLKFGQTAPLIMCAGEDVNVVVTDCPVARGYSEKLNNWQVDVVTAGQESAEC
ncbi:DeoR/GlpR family DNA-binding transcription regulator [uncultured Roseovarius sp.]|uniref:DeoR/GlpR family DNA-binding transcription regulator n=1 Tax=uncultured Roseovarius sp. TaxID=293344 RepID=UPI002623F55C|nr:DeoR/GlpR family DNA-binding transcription regulator [uncultured Roseovarius sp.]